MTSLRIVVSGLITQHPRLGGITWHYLQYLQGLARLGHDVYYVEDSGEVPYHAQAGATDVECVAEDCSGHVHYLDKTLSRYGFAGRWAYRFPLGGRWFGMPDAERRDLLDDADLLINVSGSLLEPEQYRGIPRLAYIDTDPVVTQTKIAAGRRSFSRRVATHDVHFSFGETLGDAVPTTPYAWRPTRQPIVLSEWQPAPTSRDAYTTVMSWTSYEPVEHGGRSYGQKDAEFPPYLDLPERMPAVSFELALGGKIHRGWETRAEGSAGAEPDSPPERLRKAGWRVVDADEACGDLDRYRDYVRSSRAEWSIAKNAYVAGQPGWFSERSACYLAAGRPAVLQNTGFDAVLPVGEGLLAFRSPDEAVAAIEAIESDYARHSAAARRIAEQYFDSDVVLARLVAEAMGER